MNWQRFYSLFWINTLFYTDHFKKWLEKVFFPNVWQNSILLLDSWSGHCSQAVEEAKPAYKNLKLFKIPKGTTGKIQPLDVFGFRIWKNFIRHFSDSVILINNNINLHLRNNVIKLHHWRTISYLHHDIQTFLNRVGFKAVILTKNLKILIIQVILHSGTLKHIVKYLDVIT